MLRLSPGTDVITYGWPRKRKTSRFGALVQSNVKRAGETNVAYRVQFHDRVPADILN